LLTSTLHRGERSPLLSGRFTPATLAPQKREEKKPLIFLKIEPRFLGRRARSAIMPTELLRPLFVTRTFKICNLYKTRYVGRNSAVGIATPYGLDGPGIESRWGEIFRTRPDRPWGPSSLLYNGYRVFPRGKTAKAWR
jgi:hypothetical protein